MPTVPIAERRVQTQGIPNVRVPTEVNPEAFGAGPSSQAVTQAAQQTLGKIGDVAQSFRERAIETQVTDHTAKAVKLANDLRYGEDGAFKRKGQNALGVTEEYVAKFNQKADELGAGLTDEIAKRKYKENIQKLSTDMYGDLERHTFKEIEDYEKQSKESAIQTYRENAALNLQNPGAVENSIAEQHKIIDSLRGERGDLEMMKLKASSSTYQAVLGRMLTIGKDQQAEALFKEWRPKMTESDASSIEKAIELGSTLGFAQRTTDAYAKAGLSQAQALAKARAEITEPKRRKAVIDQIEERYSQDARAQKEARTRIKDQAANLLLQSKGTAQIPVTTLAQLSIDEQTELKRYAEQLREGITPPKNSDEYYDLLTLATSPATRDEFLQRDLRDSRSKVHPEQLSSLMRLQGDLRKGDGKAEKVLDGYRTDKQIVDSALKAAGIKTDAKAGTDDAKKLNQFQAMVDEQVTRWKEAHGKSAIPTGELQKIVDGLLVEGVVDGSGIFGYMQTRRRAFEKKPGERLRFSLDSIPRSERNQIEGYLRSKNKKVTDENILRLYQAWKGESQ